MLPKNKSNRNGDAGLFCRCDGDWPVMWVNEGLVEWTEGGREWGDWGLLQNGGRNWGLIQHQIAIDLWRGHANMIKFSNICYVECEPVELNSQRSNISTCTHKYKWADEAVEPKVQRKLKKQLLNLRMKVLWLFHLIPDFFLEKIISKSKLDNPRISSWLDRQGILGAASLDGQTRDE